MSATSTATAPVASVSPIVLPRELRLEAARAAAMADSAWDVSALRPPDSTGTVVDAVDPDAGVDVAPDVVAPGDDPEVDPGDDWPPGPRLAGVVVAVVGPVAFEAARGGTWPFCFVTSVAAAWV